jgi:hypothetical protein
MLGADAYKGGFVVGGRDASAGDVDAAVWTSSDGATWTRLEADPAVFGGSGEQLIKWVLTTPDRIVAAGWDGSGGDLDAAVWVAEPR